MKIHEVVEPASTESLDMPWPELSDMLEKNCAQYIADVKKAQGMWLLRGIKHRAPDAFRDVSRENRRPRDSNVTSQKLFDTCLTRLGFTALRSNSIFTTSDFERTRAYGETYVIFPRDGQSSYTYTDRKDLVLHEPLSLTSMFDQNKIQAALMTLIERLKTLPRADHDFIKYCIDSAQDSNWPASSRLMWIVMEKQRCINLGANPRWFEIKPVQYLDVESFQKEYKPKNTGLDKALIASVEVYVTGQYYALSYRKYLSSIAMKWGMAKQ